MKKAQIAYICQNCEYRAPKWLGKCPQCESYNTFTEEIIQSKRYEVKPIIGAKPVLFSDIELKDETRIKTGIEEYDRAIGGGLVPGSVHLLGGDPGIGKSTLTLQIADQLSKNGHKILYVSAEESAAQLKIRSARLGISNKSSIYVICETQLDSIRSCVRDLEPDVVIIDSIQMIYKPEIPSAPGMITQVRECATFMTHDAKEMNTTFIIIGHITKEGTIAGPKTLEHLVDAVFYLEGDRYQSFRILRAIKNRYGPTSEIAVFEMTLKGLEEVKNPSELFLSENRDGRTGSVVTASLVGSRVLLSEIQSLTSPCHSGFPSRRVTGLDHQRIHQLIAVLDSKYGFPLSHNDVFVNVVGGIRIEEPSADLPAAIAIASSLKRKSVDASTCTIGEVGLSGEVRPVNQINLRINEAKKLGFKKIIVPKGNSKELSVINDIKVLAVSQLIDAIDLCNL
ncbi:MAG: DNA repair protein RadA [Planctomycetes bacterium]|nr:DNA repair protein RadA [Planctomycetota bacterium]